MPSRPDAAASYALCIPRAGTLLTASFRPRLAAAALAVRLAVPVIRVRRGLAPPRECALPGAHIGTAGVDAPAVAFWGRKIVKGEDAVHSPYSPYCETIKNINYHIKLSIG